MLGQTPTDSTVSWSEASAVIAVVQINLEVCPIYVSV